MNLKPLDDHKQISRVLHRLFGSAQRRARRARAENPGLIFNLKIEDVQSLWDRKHGRCAVSGLRFSMATFKLALVKHPYGPSLDRINAHKGYVRGNVRLVCTAVNFGLGQWGDEVFLPIAYATARRQAAFLNTGGHRLRDRIEAAESILPLLTKADAKHQIRRIAALKRARTLGAKGLKSAAKSAEDAKKRAESHVISSRHKG